MSIFESFRKKKAPEALEMTFGIEKKKALDFVTNGDDRLETIEGRVDSGIKVLIRKLNALPFLYTTSIGSCEGHVRIHGDKGKYNPGYIHFEIDDSETSKKFVDELKIVVARFPFASMSEREPPSLYGGHRLPGGITLSFDDRTKNGKFFPVDEARQFEADGKRLIKEIEDLIDKFTF